MIQPECNIGFGMWSIESSVIDFGNLDAKRFAAWATGWYPIFVVEGRVASQIYEGFIWS